MQLSVVMPIYNHAHFLSRAIEAIAGQSLRPDELILVNDGSTDNTAEVIERLADKYSFIRPIHLEENVGTELAVQRAQAMARGDYIYFAAADDQVAEGFFASSMELLNKNPDVPFCTALTDEEIPTIAHLFAGSPTVITRKHAIELICEYGTWFRCNTAIYRRDVFKNSRCFDPSLGPFGDGFLCMILAMESGCGFIPEVFCFVNQDLESNSKKVGRAPFELSRIFKNAEEKMAGPLKTIVPEKVRETWGTQWRYSIAKNIIMTPHENWAKNLQALSPPLSKFDIQLICAIGIVSHRLANAFALLRLSPSQFFRRLRGTLKA